MLLAWTLSNAFLGATITSLNDKDNGANATVLGYMTFLLGSVAGLACEYLRCLVLFLARAGEVNYNVFQLSALLDVRRT